MGALCAFQKPFRVYPSMEAYDDIPLPPDWQEKAEWVQARLMYPQHPEARFARFRYGRLDWREGGTSWTQDYPRADRHFALALRRLTRIDVRSVEQPSSPDDLDDFFNWPWMVAGEMGDWMLTDAQVKTLREYLLRGGFIYMDDFWGPEEYARFAESMTRVFPDRPVVEIGNDDSIFHAVYDLDDRYQVLGQWSLPRRRRLDGTARGRNQGALDGHLRRSQSPDGGDDVQQRRRGLLGVGGQPDLSGEVLGSRDPPGRELRRLLDDALVP